jgi:uncharacterized protein YecE (DUF72 family)
VIYTMPGIECPCWITADVIYLRFHGTGKKYADRYGRERLKQWAESIHAWDDRGHTIYAYFNNDLHANAIEDARTLASLLGT